MPTNPHRTTTYHVVRQRYGSQSYRRRRTDLLHLPRNLQETDTGVKNSSMSSAADGRSEQAPPEPRVVGVAVGGECGDWWCSDCGGECKWLRLLRAESQRVQYSRRGLMDAHVAVGHDVDATASEQQRAARPKKRRVPKPVPISEDEAAGSSNLPVP
ncbi:hypothetical protein B566_EDAN013491 [Ephemera danica]|nr:hypothetical protein B566_EDAN013491 [Ephemera danica]